MSKIILVAAVVLLSLLLLGCINPPAAISQGRDADGTYWRGAANPLATVYEYSDFECPNCKLEQQNVETFLSQYQGKGVRLVYKQFPLEQIHLQSRGAAIASVCAGKEGKFWEYHDILFKNSPNLSRSDLVRYALMLNISGNFESCLTGKEAASAVDADISDGLSKGISATPTFVFGDLMLSGTQPPDRLGQGAERMLAGK